MLVRPLLFLLYYLCSYSTEHNASFLGNTAGPLNLTLEVAIIDVADHISGAFVSVRKETYVFIFYFHSG